MAKPRKPPQAKAKAWYSSVLDLFGSGETPTSEPEGNGGGKQKVNLGDGAALKRALDDAAAEAIVEAGYLEEPVVTNIKLGLGAATCFFALLAQFYPKKFPDNWYLLLVCVIAYAFLSTVLNLFINNVEGDAFLITKAKNGVELRVSSRLQRYSTAYTLIIDQNSGTHKPKGSSYQVVLDTDLTSYFDVEGYLAEPIFKKDVLALLQKFEKQSPKPSPEDKKSL